MLSKFFQNIVISIETSPILIRYSQINILLTFHFVTQLKNNEKDAILK